MADIVFSGWVAQGYDAASAGMYAPEVLGPTVELLAAEAGDGRAALEARDRDRSQSGWHSRRAASTCTASSCRRTWSSSCARRPAATRSPVTIGDMATTSASSGRSGSSTSSTTRSGTC